MTLRNLMYMFRMTLLIGGISTLIIGMMIQLTDQELSYNGIGDVFMGIFMLLLTGFLYSVVSQAGFFAYLTLQYIAIDIFRRREMWNTVQLIIIVIVLFDLIYIRYQNIAESGDSWIPYIGVAAMVFLVGAAAAWRKVKLTNKTGFIPTLFFMVVGTTLEMTPALKAESVSGALPMLIPIALCNAWLILSLHRLVGRKKEE